MSEKPLKIQFQGSDFLLNIAEGNMVNLNAIHKMMGAPENQSPSDWTRLETTEKLIESIRKLNTGNSRIITSKRGRNGGTIAHWQLSLSYAQYLSSELHLAINTVFRERLEETIDPELGLSRAQKRSRKHWKAQGQSEEWISKREEGKKIRDIYVGTLMEHEVKPGAEVGHCTNQVYKGLFRKDSSELEKSIRKNRLNLPKKINIRDYAKLSSIAAIGLAEALSSEKIDDINATGVEHCAEISLEKAKSVRAALDDSREKDTGLMPPKEPKKKLNTKKNMQHLQNLKNALKKK